MPLPNDTSIAANVLAELGYAIFRRDQKGELHLQGEPPEWLRALWPTLDQSGAALPLEIASPFLENFLIDANDAWTAGSDARARSGPWIETQTDASEVTLEAIALTSGGEQILLLERQGREFEAKKAMLQTARETVIAYQRLNSETQKKEVLLSWITEQMNAALANVITSLRLIEQETNPPRTSQLLALAIRAADEQQGLIHKILVLFKAELERLYGRGAEAQRGANLGDLLAGLADDVGPQFSDKKVRLTIAENARNGTRISMDATHLKRVLSSVLETSLASARREVTVDLRDDSDAVVVRVCDDGAPLPADICDGFFAKGASASDGDASSLRLQFCRIAVSNCGGDIGYEAREPSGNCLWLRLPKAAEAR